MGDFLAMDYRDVLFWVREAQRCATARRQELILSARYAMADNEDFEDEMTRMEFQLMNIDEGD